MSRSRSHADGVFVTIRTVASSTTSTRSMIGTSVAPVALFRSGRTIRSKLYLTVCASKGSPFWNLTPVRSLNTQVFGSGFVHETASAGCGCIVFGSRCTRHSWMLSVTAWPSFRRVTCGSRESIVADWTKVSFSAAGAAAGLAWPAGAAGWQATIVARSSTRAARAERLPPARDFAGPSACAPRCDTSIAHPAAVRECGATQIVEGEAARGRRDRADEEPHSDERQVSVGERFDQSSRRARRAIAFELHARGGREAIGSEAPRTRVVDAEHAIEERSELPPQGKPTPAAGRADERLQWDPLPSHLAHDRRGIGADRGREERLRPGRADPRDERGQVGWIRSGRPERLLRDDGEPARFRDRRDR